jgi:hypothetical protein
VTLRVYTARISYRGPDALVVSRQGSSPEGLPFAPSGRILWPVLAARRAGGAAAVEPLWEGYVADYTAEMRRSYREQRAAWEAVLARESATLCCFCSDPARCHRTILSAIFGKLGAEVCGERGSGLLDLGGEGER